MKPSIQMTLLACMLLSLISMAFPQESFLLVLDVQPQFYRNTALEKDAAAMIININRIIKNTDPGKVIYVQATGNVFSISLGGISVYPQDPVPELDSSLSVVNANIFVKTKGNAFKVSELSGFLKEKQAGEVVIVGLLAEKCVYHTALGGIKKGFKIFVVPEAILGKTPEIKDKTLRKLVQKGAKLLPINDIAE